MRIFAAQLTFSSISALRPLGELEREAHIVGDIHMRIERVVLEHHRDVAVLGMDVIDAPARDLDVALGHRLKPGDHAQQCRLAAARGPEQHDEGAVLDVEVDAMDNLDVAIVLEDILD